jgi:hypothetical protein
MFHPVITSTFVYEEVRRKEAERELYHLGARVVRTEPQERLCVRVGNLLIAAGLKLQGRYQPVIVPAPKARQSL